MVCVELDDNGTVAVVSMVVDDTGAADADDGVDVPTEDSVVCTLEVNVSQLLPSPPQTSHRS